ncbi:WD40-repeat-containing domain protein [Trichoderma ceciliae]
MSPRSFRSSLKFWQRDRDSASQANESEQSDVGVKQRALLAPPIVSGPFTPSLRSSSRNRFSRDPSPHIRSPGEHRAEKTPDLIQTNDPSPVQPPTANSIAPPPVIASSSTGTETSIHVVHVKESASQPEHLWDEAYDKLKDSHPKLMQLYELILSRKLQDYNFDPSEKEWGDNQIEQDAVNERRHQMRCLIQTGQDKIEGENKVKSGMRDIMGIIMPMKNLISSTIQAAPQAALPWAIVCMSLEILQNPLNESEANANGVRYVTKRMEWYWSIATHALKLPHDGELSDAKMTIKSQLVELYQELLLFQIKSVCSYYRNRGLSLLRDTVKLDDWAGHLENIRKLEAEFSRDYGVYTSQQQTNASLKMMGYLEMLVAVQSETKETYMEQQDQQCLRDLRITNPRHDRRRIMDAKGGLLWDSYRWVLEDPQFRHWRDSEQSRLLWIKGDPGKGKTMLLCGILKELEDSTPFTLCLSYFFCQGTDQRLNNANAVLRGLIYMLVIQRPSLLSYVHKEYKDAGNRRLFDDINAWVTLSDIFENILQDPASRNCYVVIDALDECSSDRKKLLDIIVRSVSNLHHVKWIVSSRNFDDIEHKLDTCPGSLRLGLEVNANTVSEAVGSYIRYRIPRLGLLKNNEELQEVMCAQMLEKANGTFLWAALVFKELQELEDSIAEDDSEVLDILRDIPGDLTELYHRMMGQINQLSDAPFKARTRCLAILATMALAYQPILLVELPALVGFKNKTARLENVTKLVQKCGSFLTIRDGTIYFIHQSAKDYLVGAGCEYLFKAGSGVVHREIFSRSLDTMSSDANLRRNMYSLSHPGVILQDIVTPDPDPLANVRYSCIYWLRHFCESIACHTQVDGANSVDAVEKIHEFFKSYLLNWLEALSLMKHIQSGIVSLQTFIGLLKEQSQHHGGLSFFEDANRFILYHRLTIEEAPLQTYVSALMFSPMKSAIRLHFEKELSWIKSLPIVDDYWSPCIRTLRGRTFAIISFAFSSDDKLLATASVDCIIKIWDVATGGNLYMLKVDQRNAVSIMSSGDSILLALSSPLRLWDATVGKEVWSTQTILPHKVELRFSSDSKLLAAISPDFVQILDTPTGKEVQRFSNSGEYMYTQLSDDFKLLARASSDFGGIHIIDTTTGEKRYTCESCCHKDLRVAFSKNSRFFAFQLEDRTISVRDTITFDDVHLFGCPAYCSNMVFEGDLKLIACHGETIDIWDMTTGESCQIFTPPDLRSPYYRAHFSGRSRILVSYPFDTIHIWDVTMMAERKVIKQPRKKATSLALSHDAKLIALSFDLTSSGTAIWSTDTEKVVHTIVHRNDPDGIVDNPARIMAFSSDSQLLATVSRTRGRINLSVSLWSTETGKEVRQWLQDWDMMNLLSGCFALLAFSRDSTLLVVTNALGDTIRVWDTRTGQQKYALRHSEQYYMERIELSHDSKLLATKRRFCPIEVWNLESQAVIKTMPKEPDSAGILFDNSMSRTATDLGYVGHDELDYVKPPTPIQLQPITTEVLNGRFTTDIDSEYACIYWNEKKLIWLPKEYRQAFHFHAAAFASSSSVIKILTEFRGILTLEFQRPCPEESGSWTPWQSTPLFRG